MDFVSQALNLTVTIKPALPGNPLMAIPPTPGVSVRFENGRARVEDPEHIEALKKSKFFGRDFFAVEDVANPSAVTRKNERESAQEQIVVSGHDEGKLLKSESPNKELFQTAVKEAASALVKELMPSIVAKVKADLSSTTTSAESAAPATVTEAPVTTDQETTTKKAAKAK